MRAFLFNSDGDDREVAAGEACRELGDRELLWLWLEDDELVDEQRFCIPPLEAVRDEDEAPLVVCEQYFRVRCPGFAGIEARTNDLRFFVGKDWLVSQTAHDQPLFAEFIQTDRGRGLRGNLTGTGLLVSLLLTSFESYQADISNIDDSVDMLDSAILRSRSRRRMLDRLASLRLQNATLRRSFIRNRPIIRALTRPDLIEIIDVGDRAHISQLAATYDRVEDQISQSRDEVIASFELYTTKVAQDTNELIKLLTVVAVITGVVGAIAGIMGMNVDVPLKDSGPNGFYDVIVVMALCSLGILLLARARRWL